MAQIRARGIFQQLDHLGRLGVIAVLGAGALKYLLDQAEDLQGHAEPAPNS